MSDAQFIAILLATVGTLVGGIVFLYLRGERTHKRHADMTNGYLVTNAKANEHLANSIDTLPERIVDKMLASGIRNKKG